MLSRALIKGAGLATCALVSDTASSWLVYPQGQLSNQGVVLPSSFVLGVFTRGARWQPRSGILNTDLLLSKPHTAEQPLHCGQPSMPRGRVALVAVSSFRARHMTHCSVLPSVTPSLSSLFLGRQVGSVRMPTSRTRCMGQRPEFQTVCRHHLLFTLTTM